MAPNKPAHTILLLCVVLLCTKSTLATWFPAMQLPQNEWDLAYSRYNILSTYTKCSDVFSGGGSAKFISLYKKTPATIVISGTGKGFFDVKFQDSIYTFDNKITLTEAEPCVIIPPHQPVDWVMLDLPGGDAHVCVFEDTININEATDNTIVPQCGCTKALQSGAKCNVMKMPHTIRKPEHEFFLTAEITPDENDVTVTTILTVDRMMRLSQMSDFWGGPISAAVYLHELSEIHHVYDWWLSNTTMRKHVDIHLVYDDKLIAFELPDRAFPVNILRNVGLRFARTANVFYIEGDFIPSRDLYPSLSEVKRRLASGERSVFIVAPFSSYKVDFDMSIFPSNKQELRELMNTPDKRICYKVVSHPTELSQRGYNFFVLPKGFIIHLDSTGMGSAWCKAWGGTKRSQLKWEMFSRRVEHARSDTVFKDPWWDLAPVPLLGNGKSSALRQNAGEKNTALVCPPCQECTRCEECAPCPLKSGDRCPPCADCRPCPERTSVTTIHDCKPFIEGYENEVSLVKRSLVSTEDLVEKYRKKKEEHYKLVHELEIEIRQLQEINFFTNIALGSLVVGVVVGVVICFWPKNNNKKVWALGWKSSHHHL